MGLELMKPADQQGRALTSMTPREGWESSRSEQVEQLWKILVGRRPGLDLSRHHEFSARLRPLFVKATRLVDISMRAGKKPTTFVRDEIVSLSKMPSEAAVERLQNADPVLADYLDLHLEANDPDFPSIDLSEPEELRRLAERRYDLLLKHTAGLIPSVSTGPEAVWPKMAELVAELLIDITDQWPGRAVGVEGENDKKEIGLGLEFFKTFANMVVSSMPEAQSEPSRRPRLEVSYTKVWRKALSRLEEAGRRPERAPSRVRRARIRGPLASP
jgi:hypothetical protein